MHSTSTSKKTTPLTVQLYNQIRIILYMEEYVYMYVSRHLRQEGKNRIYLPSQNHVPATVLFR
jgi:hypothetical protein